MDSNRTNFAFLYVLAMAMCALLVFVAMKGVDAGGLSWSEAKKEIESGKVEHVVFDDELVVLKYKGAKEGEKAEAKKTVLVQGDETFIPLLESHGVTYAATPPSACEGSTGLILSMLLLGGFWMMMARREQGGAPPGVATFGKSSAKLAPEEGTGVTFKDIAGIDEALEELQEIVSFLKTPERFTALGGKIPKGVLLVGPPGTGKTLLARAVAGEAGVPFFSISGSDFVEMFVGVGAARVRDLFGNAARHAPCIIFIDELDAIGKARGAASPVGGHDEREQTLNQLLVEMDGFDGRSGIIIMAATNRPETLDQALMRPGRFDRQVVVDRPDVRGRKKILEIHAKGVKLGPDVDFEIIAQRTPGFAGADLANVLNEAALLAARRDKQAVDMDDINDAVERSVAGLELKSRRISPKEKRVVAFHEAGHAICAAASGADPVQKISIIPRGIGALGYTLTMPPEDRYLSSRGELRARLVVLYGGRIAEEIVFDEITTGAADDIRKASDLARRMVRQFGMSSKLGAIDYGGGVPNPFGLGPTGDSVPVSDETSRHIDLEVRNLLDYAQAEARRILQSHRGILDRMAEHLLEHEVLEGEHLERFMKEATGQLTAVEA